MCDHNSKIAFGEIESTDVSFGTSANYAYDLFLEKKRKIAALEYECELLIDKYHSEMCQSHIPPQFRQNIISDMYGKDKMLCKSARTIFLTNVFSDEFRKRHQVAFEKRIWQGYEKTGVSIILNIEDSDYYYSVEIPFPKNIKDNKTKTYLMGRVKFRADRILKSKWNDFMKEWESIQKPTYDWKKCFEAIEADVEKKGVKNED